MNKERLTELKTQTEERFNQQASVVEQKSKELADAKVILENIRGEFNAFSFAEQEVIQTENEQHKTDVSQGSVASSPRRKHVVSHQETVPADVVH